jgi:hypothetical protein
MTFDEICRKADVAARKHRSKDPNLERLRRLLEPSVSLDRTYAEIHSSWFSKRAAESTFEALVFSLCEDGQAALTEPDNRRRLAQLSTTQVRSVIARLIALRPRCPAITDQLLLLLGEQL